MIRRIRSLLVIFFLLLASAHQASAVPITAPVDINGSVVFVDDGLGPNECYSLIFFGRDLCCRGGGEDDFTKTLTFSVPANTTTVEAFCFVECLVPGRYEVSLANVSASTGGEASFNRDTSFLDFDVLCGGRHDERGNVTAFEVVDTLNKPTGFTDTDPLGRGTRVGADATLAPEMDPSTSVVPIVILLVVLVVVVDRRARVSARS